MSHKKNKTFNKTLTEVREQYKKDLEHYKQTGIKSELIERVMKYATNR